MADLATWPRPHFRPGGGDAQLYYKIHGNFPDTPKISRSKHRTAGVPDGCDLQLHTRNEAPDLLDFGLREYFGEELHREDPQLFATLSAADQCLVLRGQIPDPPNLDYLRDTVGLLAAILENGGTGIFDPFIFKWWSPREWLERAFEPAAAVPRHHAIILISEGSHPDLAWYHTRGMLKFGRPDLSVRDVPKHLAEPVEDLLNRFIELQAFGGIVPEGQQIRVKSLPEGWICRHRGDLDDPDFNNRHLEIGPT